MPNIRRIGILLAAGRGSRMGRTKQLVPWQTPTGLKPLVAAAYDAIAPICDDMIIVFGHDVEAVAAALADRPFHRAVSDPDQPMFESIRAGLRAAQHIDSTATVVLHPADHPEVAPATLATLKDWSLQRPAQAVIPQFQSRGGHPALIPPQIASLLIEADCPDGLAGFWTQNPNLCVRISIDDESITRDIDTPADLQ